MNDKLKTPDVDDLFKAVLSLETVDDCYDLFEDLCTIAEIREMAKRLKAAKMLAAGKKYAEICDVTGLSTATISRVNRSLKYGSDGYVKVLEKISHAE